MKNIIFFCLVSMLTSCKIYINADGSQMLSKTQKQSIHSFNMADANTLRHPTDEKDIYIQEIKVSDIQNLITANDYTWIVLWANCNTVSVTYMPDYVKLSNEIGNSCKFVPVSVDYTIQDIQRLFFTSHFQYPTYILDAELYGTNQAEKIKRFMTEICMDCNADLASFPVHFVFDRNQKMKYMATGRDFSPESLFSSIKHE